MATITKRKTGYCVQIRRKGFAPVSRTFKTRSEAISWSNTEEAKRTGPCQFANASSLRKISFGEILQRYLNEISPNKRGHEIERFQLASVLRAPLAELSLEHLSVSAIASYRDQRLRTVKPGTVCRELGLMQHALTIASEEWGYVLAENPAAKVRKPKLMNARSRRVSPSELEMICAELTKLGRADIMALVQFAVETAMRRGELLTLVWSNIDLSRRTAHLPATKNGHARTVPLTNGAMAVLEKLPREESLLFSVSQQALRMCWVRIVGKLGIRDLHFHDLRHEAVSRFFEMGLSMPEVALISGHRDPRMLMRYTHLVPYQLAQKLAEM